jgi:hypothetical protein
MNSSSCTETGFAIPLLNDGAEEGQGQAPSYQTYPVRHAREGGRAEISEARGQANDSVLDHVLHEVDTDQVPTIRALNLTNSSEVCGADGV